MREIKFREWHQNHMRYWDDIGFFHLYVLNDGKGVFEQYTGINDVNGKEIYVGDVVEPVRVISTPVFSSVTPLQRPMVVKEDTYVNSKWIARSVGTDNYSVEDYYFGSELRVIGNIHENPELLENE